LVKPRQTGMGTRSPCVWPKKKQRKGRVAETSTKDGQGGDRTQAVRGTEKRGKTGAKKSKKRGRRGITFTT